MISNKKSSKAIAIMAVIAAVYATVTVAFSFISYGPFQFRIAEGLTILPYFSPFAIVGLFVGCILSNIISPMGIPDLIFGSTATLIAAIITYYIGRSNLPFKKYLSPLPSVIFNALIIGIMVTELYAPNVPLYLNILYVGFGQVVCCYGLGLPLINIIEKNNIIQNYIK